MTRPYRSFRERHGAAPVEGVMRELNLRIAELCDNMLAGRDPFDGLLPITEPVADVTDARLFPEIAAALAHRENGNG